MTSINEAVNRSRLLLIVFFAAKKSLSISDDIAGIERILIAIRDNRGNRVRWAVLVYHSRAVEVPMLTVPSVRYLSYLSFTTALS